MKHKLLLLTVIWLVGQRMPAQNIPDCATDWWILHDLQQSNFQELHQQFEQGILQVFEQKKQASILPDNPKTIPVVVHIIHENGPENLSNAQIEQAITWLNQAMANQGSFQQGSGTDCGIQFCLASRTPSNTATNGITRKVNALTNMEVEFDNLSLKNLNRWNPNQYLNIWVVKSICSASYGCGVYGYAHLPYAHGSNIDGIVMEASYLTDLNRVAGLAHEVGHYLGLYHTFEGNCNNNNCQTDGDRICDTPPDASIAGVPCGNQVNSCTTDVNSGPFSADQPDMSWNFLDYGILACFHDFTPNQATRMNATLEGVRNSLLQSKGCLPPCTAAANANFLGPNTANAGETATYTSTSTNAGSFSWTINGQPVSAASTLNFQFQAPGQYVVKLVVQSTNPALCDPDEITKTVIVNCPVVSVFTASNLSPEADQMVYFTNNSQNAIQATWYINGAPQAQPPDSLVFGSPGEYSVELVSSNGFCADTQEVVILVQGICVQKTFKYKVSTENDGLTSSNFSVMSDGSLLLSNLNDIPVLTPFSPYISKFKPNGTHLWTKYLEYPTNSLSQALAKATPDGGIVIFSKHLSFDNSGLIDSFIYRLNKFDLNGNLIWGKLLHREPAGGGQKIDLQIASDGSIFVSASFLSKINPSGNEIWSTNLTGFDLIRLTPDGGLIGLIPASNVHLITKLKPDGTSDWTSSFPATAFQPKDAIAVPGGDIYLLGQLSVQPAGVIHGALVRLNAIGQTIWTKSYRQIPVSSYFFSAIHTGENGELIVAGDAKVDDPGIGPLKDYHLLMAIDTNGVMLWNKHFPGKLNIETLTRIPGSGFCITAAGGLIFRVNGLGETKNCPGEVKSITVTDIPYTSTGIQNALPSLSLQMVDEPLQLSPGTTYLDTLCAPSCLISVEICNNNLDDDGDGLFDCLDPQCNCEEERCASKTGNFWYFGNNAGLDFNSSPPAAIGNGKTNTDNTSATICDAKGNLLLYTDGKKVYNRFHQPMPNGELYTGLQVADAMIIPNPGQTGQYYVVANYGGGETFYSLVDLRLDDGEGDVHPVEKNIALTFNVQGMAAIKSCAFEGYWFVTRRFDAQGSFLSFRIDQNGLNPTPIVSPTNQPTGLIRQIKISPD
ncbi:MAG TPA: hypothetical protein DCF33_02990, partial [Saprospirales bacterium]|nr:hypothetical protein [Saprospirales bacterium]